MAKAFERKTISPVASPREATQAGLIVDAGTSKKRKELGPFGGPPEIVPFPMIASWSVPSPLKLPIAGEFK